MPPPFLKPENILKRSEELILVGQPQAALQNLHEFIVSKRHRSSQLSFENVLLRYISLVVDMRKGKMAREALTQYRNMSQHVNIYSLEVVIKKFIELATEKVTNALSSKVQDTVSLEQIEDLEELESPQVLLFRSGGAYSGEEPHKEKPDKDLVMPWFRFLWEVYRISLDVLRNNNKLEGLYQTTSEKAFQFCIKYGRKHEFKRLSDVLRAHLSTLMKTFSSGSLQNNAIQLSHNESYQIQLEIRFSQLHCALNLEIWQEAFKSIEDIYSLFLLTKKPIKTPLMISYYEALVKIFKTSANFLFLAASLNKLFGFATLASSAKNMPDLELSKLAGNALLAALSVPIRPTSTTTSKLVFGENLESEAHFSKDERLTLLLGFNKALSRESLLKEALGKSHSIHVPKLIKDIYSLIEGSSSFSTLVQEFCRLSKLLIEQDKTCEIFLPSLKKVVFFRLFQKLSRVYSSMSFGKLKALSSELFENISLFDLEFLITKECRFGHINVFIDHGSGHVFIKPIYSTLVFAENEIFKSAETKPFASPLSKLHELSSNLNKFILQEKDLQAEFSPSSIFFPSSSLRAQVEEEHTFLMNRKILIEKRKEQMEMMLLKKEKEEAQERAQRLHQEQELEKQRRLEDAKRREFERLKKEKEEIQKEEKRRIAEQMNQKLASVGKKLSFAEINELDRHEIIKKQVKHLEEGKREVEKRALAMAKRIDYYERALRKEELPLLSDDYSKQKALDLIVYEKRIARKLAAAKIKHETQVHLSERANKIWENAEEFMEIFKNKRQAHYEKLKQSKQAQLEEEKAKRRESVLESRYQAALVFEQQEKERKLLEEQQRLKEQALKEAKEKQEEQKRILDEKVKRQLEATREARKRQEEEAQREVKAKQEQLEEQKRLDDEKVKRQLEATREAREREEEETKQKHEEQKKIMDEKIKKQLDALREARKRAEEETQRMKRGSMKSPEQDKPSIATTQPYRPPLKRDDGQYKSPPATKETSDSPVTNSANSAPKPYAPPIREKKN